MEAISNTYKLMGKPILNEIHRILCWAWFHFISILAARVPFIPQKQVGLSQKIYMIGISRNTVVQRQKMYED